MRESYFKNKETQNRNTQESYLHPSFPSITYQNFMHKKQFRELYEKTNIGSIHQAAARWKSMHSNDTSTATERSSSCTFRRVDRETVEKRKNKVIERRGGLVSNDG